MKYIAAIIVFLIGIAFLCTYKSSDFKEGFSIDEDCPNLLVQKGKHLHLIYSNKAKIPGVNPVIFNNLEEYTEFLKWQRAKGIRCPVLYFQQTYDAQNNVGYRMLPNPIEKQAGLSSFTPPLAKEQPLYDANHDDLLYNKNDYPGFDPQDQYIGAQTPLDKNFHSSEKISPNAMDSNWGGAAYSENLTETGMFAEDTRKSYDNPYIPRKKNVSFQNEFPSESAYIRHKKTGAQSNATKEKIAAAYGGHLENKPMERAVVLSTGAKK